MMQQIEFVKDDVFSLEEGRNIEFKKIDSKRPVDKIVNHAEQYVTGFLNASVEGNVYLGIDDDGKILGIHINQNERDKIQREIANKLTQTDPSVPIDCYDVEIHNVYDSEHKQIEDICIVQIHISKVEEDSLYKASGNEFWLYQTKGESIYFKKGSSCIKLDSEGIKQLIKNRHQKLLRKDLANINEKLAKYPNEISLLQKKAEIAKYLGDLEIIDDTYKKLIMLNAKNPRTRAGLAHLKSP